MDEWPGLEKRCGRPSARLASRTLSPRSIRRHSCARLPGDIAGSTRQLLLFVQEFLASRDPFVATDDGMICHENLP
jgi:hypothetical protein